MKVEDRTTQGSLDGAAPAPDVSKLADVITGYDDEADARASAEAVLAHAELPADGTELASALTVLGLIAWHDGRLIDALGLLRAAVSCSDTAGVGNRRSYPRLPLALLLATLGELALADAEVVECRSEITRLDDRAWTAAPMICRAYVTFASGRFRDALAEVDEAALAARRGGNRALATLAGVVRDFVRLHAETAALGAADVAGQALPRVFPDTAPALVRAALEDGDRDRATLIVLESECVAAENFGIPAVDAAARHARGLLEGSPDMLRFAAGEYRHPLASAAAHEDAGMALVTSDRDAARAELECSLSSYEQAGAGSAVERVRCRLHELSARGTRQDRPRWGWASLTETETCVSRVVAAGLTNAQVADRMFLSRHTIDFHLRQIYRKLEINCRVELTRLVLEHEG